MYACTKCIHTFELSANAADDLRNALHITDVRHGFFNGGEVFFFSYFLIRMEVMITKDDKRENEKEKKNILYWVTYIKFVI